MGLLEEILLGLLVAAFAAFPVAVFLYLRTAYRGGWMAGGEDSRHRRGLLHAISCRDPNLVQLGGRPA